MKNQKNISVQSWLPFDKIFDKGIIQLKDKSYIKIIKVIPINYNLKSELEKEAILNSYKIFLKTCNFDIQILVQSTKKDLSNHITKIKEKIKQDKRKNISEVSKKYIEFINKLNQEKNSSSKNFYIIIKIENKNPEEVNISELNENYLKIKECLSRCGNNVVEIEKKEELKNILYSFFNTRKNLLK